MSAGDPQVFKVRPLVNLADPRVAAALERERVELAALSDHMRALVAATEADWQRAVLGLGGRP